MATGQRPTDDAAVNTRGEPLYAGFSGGRIAALLAIAALAIAAFVYSTQDVSRLSALMAMLFAAALVTIGNDVGRTGIKRQNARAARLAFDAPGKLGAAWHNQFSVPATPRSGTLIDVKLACLSIRPPTADSSAIRKVIWECDQRIRGQLKEGELIVGVDWRIPADAPASEAESADGVYVQWEVAVTADRFEARFRVPVVASSGAAPEFDREQIARSAPRLPGHLGLSIVETDDAIIATSARPFVRRGVQAAVLVAALFAGGTFSVDWLNLPRWVAWILFGLAALCVLAALLSAVIKTHLEFTSTRVRIQNGLAGLGRTHTFAVDRIAAIRAEPSWGRVENTPYRVAFELKDGRRVTTLGMTGYRAEIDDLVARCWRRMG